MLHEQTLSSLKGVGPKLLEKLHKLGLFTVQDLLFHLPLRYEDKTRLTPIEDIEAGRTVLLEGTILSQVMTRSRNASLLVKMVTDEGVEITCRFFHVYANMARKFSTNSRMRTYGELKLGPTGYEIIHPTVDVFNAQTPPPLETSLTPVYPATEGLGQAGLLKLMRQAVSLLAQYPLNEALPDAIIHSLQLPPINQSLYTLHQPLSSDDLWAIKQFKHPAQQRLIFEELLSHQLGLLKVRQTEQKHAAPVLPNAQASDALLALLPFSLTNAQKRVWQEISADLKNPYPMQRMVQGDVGSGKTVVAAMAAIQAADAGFQVAIMAPTEILAEQHLIAFTEWLTPLGISVAWLNGRMKVGEKRDSLAQIASGEARVVIGTHALFQDAVIFNKLGLVIIDEQHRFGVHQRLSLQEKSPEGFHPHQLVMTATPIPRTLAMTAYGDLNLSVIDELPPGRKPIETAVISNTKRDAVMENLVARCEQGIQAYWVCPLIEESDVIVAQAAEVTASLFTQRWPNLRVGLIHGRLKGEQKALLMQLFKSHQLDLLVATTVIEVGVNVPNSSLMIIENAERLGLAQLHQLRGRVGRGDIQSHCVLLYQSPLSEMGKARLNIMRETTDGFRIAEEDLKIRGPGDILGTRQTGGLLFRIADLLRDQHIIPLVQQTAESLHETHPNILNDLHTRWIGHKEDYKRA